jgi:hypothetical protein
MDRRHTKPDRKSKECQRASALQRFGDLLRLGQ